MSVRETANQSNADSAQFTAVEQVFNQSAGTFAERIDAFPKFASRQALARFIVKYELFKRVLHVNGSIVECGVLHGGGLLTFAKLSAILEPVNHTRKIIGFDTFEGFPSIHERDSPGTSGHLTPGGLTGSALPDVEAAVELFDLNRSLAHIPKVELVQGDLTETADRYVAENQHLVIALLYLDVDLYAPTAAALRAFVPRMPKGAVIVFDELNAKIFPGETSAVEEVLGLKNLRIERFSFDSYISYHVVE
jgi:hypothetical protein